MKLFEFPFLLFSQFLFILKRTTSTSDACLTVYFGILSIFFLFLYR